jgi:hypothetical protein
MIADRTMGRLFGVDEIDDLAWIMGTGDSPKGNLKAQKEVNDRIYLIIHVWGYSRKLDIEKRQTPEVSMTCLSTKSNPATNSSSGRDSKAKTKYVCVMRS